ncbi:hypothetical protein GCM10010172_87440 [Paractinoplanes ferrugineus]|uniref:CHAT domain-containing protein n=1 Tax=Paractinoplanes ferrugineus TaxID=113564 RepID=A0A919MIY1_9ACTN|nr:CHAT domain-containing protein [Actinoplanes ferrugineus]GIE16519.1 hypothetical protein Afe05nite_83590 [Actinoplanes ferrugineus]
MDRAGGRLRWRWLLCAEGGGEIATHQVDLDPTTFEYEAFGDLAGCLRRHRAPHDPVGSAAEIMDRVGHWLGETVLGADIGRELVIAAPVTVVVRLPPAALFLLDRPLEMAVLGNRPLSRLGIGLVLVAEPEDATPAKRVATDRLRLLALFSMPSRMSVLAQRREREELERLVRGLAGTGFAVELRVLQHGVTRDKLADAAGDGDGWDIVHLSGHGSPGCVVLEKEDGAPDEVSTSELLVLLRPLRERLKLILLSACDSGRALAADVLRLLTLTEQADALQAPDAGAREWLGMAHGLVAGLDLTVVAMRYAVTDEFAVAFAGRFYQLLLGERRPVDVAFRQALTDTVETVPAATLHALSAVAPALFGAQAVGLFLGPPRGQPATAAPAPVGAGFLPPLPASFVGRAPTMLAASRALAPRSNHRAIVFTGMAGAGKTACAVEAAHQHVDRFAATVWWSAPTAESDADNSLAQFAAIWERRLGSPLTAESSFASVAGLVREQPVLVVLDNAESLIDNDGEWRDPLFAALLEVLCQPQARSRVILTSRTVPRNLPTSALVQPIYVLTLAESALLARELPHLGRLLAGRPGPDGTVAEVAAGRRLVRRMLGVVQGHPKLLELADAAAADPAELERRLDVASRSEAPVRDFFATGTSGLDESAMLRTLAQWTTATFETLSLGGRLLAEVLACALDTDRQSGVAESVWHLLWREHYSDPIPAFAEAVAELQRANLVDVGQLDVDGITVFRLPGRRRIDSAQTYRLHPAIASTIRSATGEQRCAAIEDRLGQWWSTVAHYAAELEKEGDTTAAPLIVGANIAALPYFNRRRRWTEVAQCLGMAGMRAMPEATIRLGLTQLRPGLDTEQDPEQRLTIAGVYAHLLTQIDPADGIRRLQAALDEARRRELHTNAVIIAGNLVNALMAYSSPQAALIANRELRVLQQAAGAGRFTLLQNEVQELQICEELGQYDVVLRHAPRLLSEIDRTPMPSPTDGAKTEMVIPRKGAESLLSSAAAAAAALGRFQLALELNEEHQRRLRARNATAYERAQAAVNAVPLLIPLGRLEDAERALGRCQSVFEEENDIGMLGIVFAHRAKIQSARGRAGDAVALQERALRYLYQRPTHLSNLANAHSTLAYYRHEAGDDAPLHLVAATLLTFTAGRSGGSSIVLMPRDGQYDLGFILDRIITADVERVPGVRFGQVLSRAVPDPVKRARMLAMVMAPMLTDTLRQLMSGPAGGLTLEGYLDQLACTREWQPLVGALRQTRSGRPADLNGLDDVTASILRAVLG